MLSVIPQLQALLGRPLWWAVVLVTLACVLVWLGWLRRRGAERLAAAWAVLALAVVVTGVLSLTLYGPASGSEVPRRLFLDPVAGAWGWDGIAWRPVLDNVALFVPVGALAAASLPRRGLVLVWSVCVALSIGIETFQFLVPTGRTANTADVLANATGAALGIVLAILTGSRRRRRTSRPAPAARTAAPDR